MSREQFKDINFRAESMAMIDLCNAIIVNYQAQNLRLTLRQLYYQLVTRNAIRNEERAYKRMGNLLSDARLAGLVDWDAIEDRIRKPITVNEYTDLNQLVEAALYSYRLPRWKGQEAYVELWVEKDALAGVLQPLAREFHVTMMVNRGYSSQSAMYEAAERFRKAEAGDMQAEDDQPRRLVLFYLGDMDPSGEDMVRDIEDRLLMFGVDVDVMKLALTMEQVAQYNPPPNPAKMSDSRAAAYVARHGDESWEVDALPPDVLAALIRQAFEDVVDVDAMDEVKEEENRDKKELAEAVKELLARRG